MDREEWERAKGSMLWRRGEKRGRGEWVEVETLINCMEGKRARNSKEECIRRDREWLDEIWVVN